MLRKVEITMFLAFDRIKELADKQKISLNILEEKLYGYVISDAYKSIFEKINLIEKGE